MQRRPLYSAAAAVVLTLGAAACSDSTGPATNQQPSAMFEAQVNTDIAPTAGEEAASDYAFLSGTDISGSGGVFSASVPGATAGLASGFSANVVVPPSTGTGAWISSACTFSAATGRFTCPPVSKGGQTYTASYALFDAKGVNQSAYDKVTTAAINFIVTDSGAVSFSTNGNTFSDTTLRRHNRTVSGLAGDPDTVRTWNGTGTASVRSARAGQIAKSYTLVGNDTTTNVRFRQPRDINPYPLSGMMVKNFTVTRARMATDTVSRTTTRRVVVTFNGTVNVPMQIGSDSYMLNLDTRKVTKQ